jgi:periplasmic divalent cation tolerance protein
VCFTTVSTKAQANSLASELISRRIAACVQIDGPINSFFQWKGEVCQEEEFRLAIKTRSGREQQLRQAIQSVHPYEQPQIITLQSIDVDPGYSQWVCENVD